MVSQDDFEFDAVAFFGRGLEEYIRMFDLQIDAMNALSVLDCPAGPSSFACEAELHGIRVVGCDPMYEIEQCDKLRPIVDHSVHTVAAKQASNAQLFHKELVPAYKRRESMELFLDDYETGRLTGRYVPAALPILPFADMTFDLVLSANLLFIYADLARGGMMENSPFDYQFHRAAVNELVRVARSEVRIYPLLGAGKSECSFVQMLMDELSAQGLHAYRQPVAQRDIVGAEDMLVIARAS
jgi:hypothetical protein